MQTQQIIEIFLVAVPLYCFVAAMAWHNWKTKLFPNRFILPAFIYFFAIRVVLGPGERTSYILGAVLAFSTLFLVGYIYYRLKGRPGIGGGDIKLLTTIGMAMGWVSSLIMLAVLFSATLAFMTRPEWAKRGEIPTGGVYLAGVTIALLITHLWL